MARSYLFAVFTVFFINNIHKQMVFLKQIVQAIEKFYIPLEACNVPQFAFAAFSRVAAGYKVNSS